MAKAKQQDEKVEEKSAVQETPASTLAGATLPTTQATPTAPTASPSTAMSRQTQRPTMQFKDPFAEQDGDTSFMEDDQDVMRMIDEAQAKNIGLGEIKISRIAIGQPGTPEIAGKQDGYKGMEGCFLDNITREIISTHGKAPWMLAKGARPQDLADIHFLPVVPIFKLPIEYAKWPNLEERKAGQRIFHWKSLDVTEARVREGLWAPKGTLKSEKGVPPPVTEHINWLVQPLKVDMSGEKPVLYPNGNVMIASYSRTSFPAGQAMTRNVETLKANKHLSAWYQVQYIWTPDKPEQNEKGTFYVADVAPGPMLTEVRDGRAVRDLAKNLAMKFADPSNGRSMQELYLNAAAFAEEGDSGSTGSETTVPTGSETTVPNEEPAF
jgi:hypothetical protein